jgi:cellulose synthase/poly-beta-1,6-N-acetylglucosamine synthase-like glycosyltransferase
MALLLNGERVTFAPEAVVWGEMHDKLSSSTSQHMRWEQGKKQIARSYVPKLFLEAWKELWAGRPGRTWILWDALMEFLQPPFSVLAMLSLVNLAASLALFLFAATPSASIFFTSPGGLAALNPLVAVGLLLGQGVYLFAGLRATSAPRQVYLNLLNAPRLMIWKSWQMFLALVGQGDSPWIRTKRNEE